MELKNWDCGIRYDETIYRELKAQEDFQYPYQEEAKLPVKISVSEWKRLSQQRALQAQESSREETDGIGGEELLPESFEQPPKPLFLSEENSLTGARKGTLYHLALEHLPYGKLDESSDKKAINTWLDELVMTGYLREEERKALWADKFRTFLQSSVGKRMAQAARKGELYREQQFMMGKPADSIYPDSASQETVLVQGIIDAWFQEGEEIVLVDYKTDRVGEKGIEELADKYRVQLDCYREALERMTGKRVKEEIIYSLSLGESIILRSQDE
jgi:ATP-dependent helicase/nuclease subunit A